MTNHLVEIVLATYNGEQYLCEQLDSLLGQSYQNLHILVQDDGSTDQTNSILRRYCRQNPSKITLTRRTRQEGGAQGNFYSLLLKTGAPYVMLCDQDDVWHPNKVQLTLEKMKELEQAQPGTPILVHTDLAVVDASLCMLSPSFFQSQKLSPQRADFFHLLSQNVVTGCTVMVNRALLSQFRMPPKEAVMHDHWLALLAAGIGLVGVVEKPTLFYRQHSHNAVGAKQKGVFYSLHRLLHAGDAKEAVAATYRQAQAFLEQYGDVLDEERRQALARYAGLPQRSKIARICTLLHCGPLKSGTAEKIGQLLFC